MPPKPGQGTLGVNPIRGWGVSLLLRITNRIFRRELLGYAVSYVEPDGTREMDIKDCIECANDWADWCREDGCTEVTIDPIWEGDLR